MQSRYSASLTNTYVIVNFKTYERGTGTSAVQLAKMCQTVVKKYNLLCCFLAVQPADVHEIARAVELPVLVQHIDPIRYGAHTGSVLLESVETNGAQGSLVNHLEKRMRPQDIKITVKRLRERNLLSILCVQSSAEITKYHYLRPHMIALESSELVGGKISISTARPQLVRNAVKAARNIPLLVGAGIHTTKDVRTAVSLGAQGVLVSSDILLSKNPQRELQGLLRGFI